MRFIPLLIILLVSATLLTCSRGKLPYDVAENDLISPAVDSANELRKYKTVFLKASDKYLGGGIKKVMQGTNYRTTWNAPIEVPILWLDTLYGGVEIVEEGGNGQSRSMDLKDKQNHYYKLRSINKNPTANAPAVLRKLAGQIILDVTSAGHPYAAIPAARLAGSLNLAHTHPKLYYLPRQPVLDTLNDRYGSRLFLLEHDPQGTQGDWINSPHSIIDMPDWEDMIEVLMNEPKARLDQETMLRARLLDLIVGDWDRHPGNWGWGKYMDGSNARFIPIIIDRDMVFFKLEGFIQRVFTLPFIDPRYQAFCKEIRYLPGMMINPEPVDKMMLNRLTEEDFQRIVINVQQTLTDEVIEEALRLWPDTIYKLTGEEVKEKIMARRRDLPKYASAFYRIISEKVEVPGTHAQDHFVVTPARDGKISVKVMADTDKSGGTVFYERTFDPELTEELILVGLNSDDVFELKKGDYGKMKFTIIGGKGKDEFRLDQDANLRRKNIKLLDDDKLKVPSGFSYDNFDRDRFFWSDMAKELED